MTTISLNDFHSICRGCLLDCKNTISFNVHGSFVFENEVGDILAKYASIQVSRDDPLPKQLCQQCFQDLSNCHMFIVKCQRSQQTLLSILNQQEIKMKVEEAEIKQEEIEISDFEGEIAETDVQNHEKYRKAYRQQCEHCGRRFRKLSSLRFHTCTRTDRKPFKCEECGSCFKLRHALNMHVKKTHLREKPRKGVRMEENNYTCDVNKKGFCNMSDRNKPLLKLIEENTYSCSFFEKTFTQQEQTTREMLTEGTTFTCDMCNKQFKNKTLCDRHLNLHLKEKLFKCGYCGKEFARKEYQVAHEKSHTRKKSFKCGFCEKVFARKADQIVHERSHEEEKLFKCGFCEKDFARKEYQVAHERTHTAEKPFICGFCGKNFTRKRYQIIHERTHTREQPYPCDVCKKSFNSKSALNRHSMAHLSEKPFKCSFCENRYSRKLYQIMHERIHSKDNSLAPNGCKRLQYRSDGKEHSREKPHKCNICKKTFSQKGTLVAHKMMH